MGFVELSKGHVYVLDRPENITKGDWRMGVTCKSCGKPILTVEDPSAGRNPVRFVGDGRFRIPCYHCHASHQYEGGEMSSIQAAEDVQIRRPTVKPSGSSRQPLKNRYPRVQPTFSAAWLEDRPEAASGIGRCIALWTEVESALARLLATILKTNTEPAAAMFLALRSGRAQTEVLEAAAQVVLSKKDYELFSALMGAKAAVEKERNHLAHGAYGSAYGISEGVAWMDPTHLVQHTVMTGLSGVTEESNAWVRERTFIYEPADIETIAVAIGEVRDLITSFIGLLDPDWARMPAERDKQYRQLSSRPRIARELRRLREGPKRTR